MKPYISISTMGAIRVLGIPLGEKISMVKDILPECVLIDDNANCIRIRTNSFDNLPTLDITFRKDVEDRIDEIRIGNPRLNQKECDKVYDYFKSKLYELNIVSEKTDGKCTTLELSNLLHKVYMFKQAGLGDDENKFPFFLTINGRLLMRNSIHFKNNEQQQKTAIRELYYHTSNRKQITTTLQMNINAFYIIKIVIVIAAIIICYLFALNGRYSENYNGFCMDKWTKKGLFFSKKTGKYETIQKIKTLERDTIRY